MNVSVVVFDWFATLAMPHEDDFWPRLPELIAAAGGVSDDDSLQEWTHSPIEHVAHSASEQAYRAWQRNRMADHFARCGLADPARSRLLDEIEDLRYSRRFNVFPDVPAALASLRASALRVGLCSNWDWDLDRHLRTNEIDHLFDFVVCSASFGYRKPHPQVFAQVIDHAGVTPDQIVFVGDNWHDDIDGAVKAGMWAVHIARTQACDQDPHGDTQCVSDLEQLLHLLLPTG